MNTFYLVLRVVPIGDNGPCAEVMLRHRSLVLVLSFN
jgi:hypothetical protein